jgi:hypothetical protein
MRITIRRCLIGSLLTATLIQFASADVSISSSSYIGVVGRDSVDASAIAANGEIYVAGSTSLADRWGGAAIPLSTTVADAGAFVARLNTDLSAAHRISLLEQFTVNGMAIAANGDVYLAGNSFLGKSVLFGETLEGDIDAVVVKLNSALTSILAAKIVGGGGGQIEMKSSLSLCCLLPTAYCLLPTAYRRGGALWGD